MEDEDEIALALRCADKIVFHNARYDIEKLAMLGIEVPWEKVEDTLPASHVFNSLESHRLKDLALKYCDIHDRDQEALRREVVEARRAVFASRRQGTGDHRFFNITQNQQENVAKDYWLPKAVNPDSTALFTYAGNDAVRTMQLWMLYRDMLEEDERARKCYERERALLPVVYDMERRGVALKPTTLRRRKKEHASLMENAEVACKMTGGDDFNVRSHPQIRRVESSEALPPVAAGVPQAGEDTHLPGELPPSRAPAQRFPAAPASPLQPDRDEDDALQQPRPQRPERGQGGQKWLGFTRSIWTPERIRVVAF
jgi:DNA polymerase I-like protein with 3'-5' exonuclease and polymerase domains